MKLANILLFSVSMLLHGHPFKREVHAYEKQSPAKTTIKKCSVETYCPQFKAFLSCEISGTDCSVDSRYGEYVKCSAKTVDGDFVKTEEFCF